MPVTECGRWGDDGSAPAPRYDRRCLGAAEAVPARGSRQENDNRRFIDAVCWVLRTGAPWRDLPPDYGDWKNTHRRFCRWRDRGVWAGLLEEVMDDPDWLMIDASYIKAHPHSAGVGAEIRLLRTKGGQQGFPRNAGNAVTGGTVADCSLAF